jgi:hypothetical protein
MGRALDNAMLNVGQKDTATSKKNTEDVEVIGADM